MKDIFETSEDIIKQGFSEIDKEIQDDEEVRKEAEYITKKLLSNPKVTVNYENEYAETLEERFELFEQLPSNEKGIVESYDWGEDLGKEIFD